MTASSANYDDFVKINNEFWKREKEIFDSLDYISFYDDLEETNKVYLKDKEKKDLFI